MHIDITLGVVVTFRFLYVISFAYAFVILCAISIPIRRWGRWIKKWKSKRWGLTWTDVLLKIFSVLFHAISAVELVGVRRGWFSRSFCRPEKQCRTRHWVLDVSWHILTIHDSRLSLQIAGFWAGYPARADPPPVEALWWCCSGRFWMLLNFWWIRCWPRGRFRRRGRSNGMTFGVAGMDV